MTTSPDILERTFPARPDAFERLVRRRARRERTRKITVGALALILVIALVAALAGALALRRQRSEPLNGPITPSNVSQLGLVWSSPAGAAVNAQPLVVDDRVFVIDTDDRLRVYPASCRADVCAPLWTTKLGPTTTWVWGGPVRSGDRVYVPTSSGRVVAYPTTCSSPATCDPVWTARLGGDLSSASPVVADGVVYAATNLPSEGVIGAFPGSCPSAPRPCAPLWTGTVPGGFVGSQPMVANGLVYVGSRTGILSAFPTSCASSGGRCRPSWTASPSAADHAPWSEMIVPILATGDTVFVPVGSALYAYPAACRGAHGACRPRWVAHTENWINSLALDGSSVYVSSTDGVLSVFPRSCARRCAPAWTVDVPGGGGNPTVADGVLYVGWEGGTSAYDAACGAGGGGCAPLWKAPRAMGSVIDFPTVTAGQLYAGADDGRLYVFGLGGSARFPSGAAPGGSQRGQSALYGVVYGLLALAVIAWVIRRRRRRDAAPSPQT